MLTGFKKTCYKSSGGVLTIFLAEREKFKSATLDAESEAYSAITMETGGIFVKYEFAEDEAEFKEELKYENGSVSVVKSIIFKIPNMNGTSRKAVSEIADASFCGMVSVVKTPNQEAFVVGYGEDVKLERPLRISQSSGTTGKKMGDARGEEVTLTCEHSEKSRLFTGDVDALLVGTV